MNSLHLNPLQLKYLYRTTILLGVLAGALALCLLALALLTHGSQGMFQLNRPVADYAALLIGRAGPLRIDLALDFLYMCAYAAFFIVLAAALASLSDFASDRAVPPIPAGIWVGALLLTAVLDMTENAHILSMLTMAEQGMPISPHEIGWQTAASQVKFVSSYFGLFLLSFCLPADTLAERVLVFVLRWVQAPVGVAIFVLPAETARPLFLARAIFFVAGFWTIAWIVRQRGVVSSSGRSPAFAARASSAGVRA